MIYAYAAMKEGVPFANGAPNLTVDLPLHARAFEGRITLLSAERTSRPARRSSRRFWRRPLRRGCWVSRDGTRRTFSAIAMARCWTIRSRSRPRKNRSLGVLDFILQPELYPDLYKDIYHKVRINYYPPRGDNKEGWDNIDIFGWLGYPMQIKVDFLCRDSILAAPIALDLVLFLDLAKRTTGLAASEFRSG